MARDGMISGTTAARRLRKNYRTMLDMVPRGELQGHQADNGRWSVPAPHVARRLTGHKTDSVYARYNIVNTRDLSDAASRLAAHHQKQRIGRTEAN